VIWMLALAGCGTVFGPPVTCKVRPLSADAYYASDPFARDLVCHVDEDLEDYWVILEGEDDWGGEKTWTFGHHGSHKGSLDHHEDARVGHRVTVEADGYWSRRFTIPFDRRYIRVAPDSPSKDAADEDEAGR